MSLTMAKLCPETLRSAPRNLINSVTPDTLQWYAVYTQPRHEKVVAKHLDWRELETYLPLHREARRWNGRKTEVELPLFTGYVFVRLRYSERLKVLEHPSVVAFVNTKGRPAVLPDLDIESLRRSLAQRVAEPFPYLVPGKRIRIHSGPLTGLEGTILRKKGKLRLVVSVDLLHRSVAVDLEPADLRPAA